MSKLRNWGGVDVQPQNGGVGTSLLKLGGGCICMTQKWEGGYSCVAEGHDIVAPPPGVFWHLPLVPKKILNILGNLKKIAITLIIFAS